MNANLRKCESRLHRAEEAQRQVQRHLVMIERQIQRRMAELTPQFQPKPPRHGRVEPPDPKAFLERYRRRLAALTAERQPEIDALSRKLARQDRALAEIRQRRSDLSQMQPQAAPSARDDHSQQCSSARGMFERQAP